MSIADLQSYHLNKISQDVVQSPSNSEPSSSKIMDKLKEIKRIFNENQSIYQTHPPTVLQSHQMISIESRENSKLRKYLPESMSRERDFDDDRNDPIVQIKDDDRNAFKSQLQSKLETLINQQKSLLRNRYDMNDEEYGLGRTGKFGQEKSSLNAMQRKIKQLESKFSGSKPPNPKKTKQQTRKLKEDRDQDQKQQKQICLLRQGLAEMRLLNEKLMSKLLKRKNRKSTSKDKVIQALSKQVQSLRKEVSSLKPAPPPYVVCAARVQSRERAISSFVQNHKKVQHSILVDLYGQIEDLQYKLNRQKKERMSLQEKNHWLEEQLRKFTC